MLQGSCPNRIWMLQRYRMNCIIIKCSGRAGNT